MSLNLPPGTTSYLKRIFARDSTTGLGKTGLTSASFTWKWIKLGDSSMTSVSPSGGTLGTWSSGGIIEVDATNAAGVYEIGLPDASLSTTTVMHYLRGTGFTVQPIEIQLDNSPGDLKKWLGTAPNALNGGRVEVTPPVVRRNTAQAGATNSITLDASASSVSDFYKGCLVYIESGTGAGQARLATASNGTTKVVTVSAVWATNPASDSVFVIYAWSDSYYCGSMATGLITASALSLGATTVLGNQVIVVTGSTSPALDGTYSQHPTTPFYQNKPAFMCNNVGSIYYDGSKWILTNSTTIGTAGATSWQAATDELGAWSTNTGSPTGSPVAVSWWSPSSGKNPTLRLVDSSGRSYSDLRAILGTTLTETVGGYLTAGFKKFFDIAAPVFTTAAVNQTGDSYARLGAPAGASVSADVAAVNAKTTNLPAAPASTTNITSASGITLADAAITTAKFSTGAIDSTVLATDAIGADEISAAAVTKIQTGLPTAAENATELLDQAAGVETGKTVRQSLRLMLATLIGKLSGAATTTIVIRDTNDSKDRVTATVDSSGNRTSVTTDGT